MANLTSASGESIVIDLNDATEEFDPLAVDGADEEFDPLAVDGADEDFDPLAVDDSKIDQEWMDDDNPYDIVDFPTMRNMPESDNRFPVYSPDTQGSVTEALRALITENPNRRPVLLGIIGLCEGGCLSSVITEKVKAWQEDNWSVYEPMTFCRMLERAGALTLTMPEVAAPIENDAEGTKYLEIKETVDPTWTSTPEALELCAVYNSGSQFREIVLEGAELQYSEVYAAIMSSLQESPMSIGNIEAMADTFEITHSPKRYGQHFVDVLERCDCIAWSDKAWCLTELGEKMLDELKGAM